MYKKSIFWFRQDLRTYDNTGLIESIKHSSEIIPLFILDTHIIESFGGLQDQKFGFLREVLEQLSESIKELGGKSLLVMHGKPEEIIPILIKKYDVECIFTNTSYGTYGKKRDRLVAEKSRVDFKTYADYLLVEPHEIETRKVFTPFYKLWKKIDFYHEERNCERITQSPTEENFQASDFITTKQHPYFTMKFGYERFQKLPLKNYDKQRNALDIDGTSRLSPYLRFGIFSIRQIFNKHLNKGQIPEKGTMGESYISELAWREFWWHIYYNFPNTKRCEFQEKRRFIEWSQDQELFEKWCKGETGYPIVDAAMKQLNETNWMHGRARMIVASFLTKDLHIDWRLGELYFKKMLLDYDEGVNLGNWQWGASVGADPKPLRIFSPLLQSEKFDPEAKFIKKYIPKLKDIELKRIHDPIKHALLYTPLIVDHREEQAKSKDIYKQSSIDFESQKNSD